MGAGSSLAHDHEEKSIMGFSPDWYPIALSDGLEPGTSAGTRLFDKEIVVWRDQDGVAHTWEDRCPHRGMRLSFGFVRGNHIACLYHGWQYGPEGQCRYIPAHPNLTVPSTIRVSTYACRERLGMVWIYSEPESEALAELPPEPCQVTPVRSLHVDRAPDAVRQYLLAGVLPAVLTNDDGEDRPGEVQAQSASLLAFTLGSRELLAALQPVGETKTALHLVIAGRPEDCRGQAQTQVALWAEALRRDLEAPSFAIAPLTTRPREAAP
jgi:nitrite reductase/ring-hydroxylating ferredoxin subunit